MVGRGMTARARKRSRSIVRAALGALLALGATLLGAGPATAGLQREYSVFGQCPLNTPGVSGCFVAFTTSGEFHLGSKTVPIDKTITLQGGLDSASPDLVPAANGETLSKTALQLPGGLLGVEFLPPLTEVQATAELAGPVGLNLKNFFAESGTAISLPLKVNLVNPLLGSSCYIGSESSPVAPQLTTGTTSPPSPGKPISGRAGKVEFLGAGNITLVSNTLVDNTFSVPGASGCGGLLSFLVDPSVDAIAGVPATAGHNTAILNGTFEDASARLVKAQREIPEIGRCVKAEGVKQGKETIYSGSYSDSGCVNPEKNGRYEWIAGPGPNPAFTDAAGSVTLETVGGAALKCKHAQATGDYTGAKTVSATARLTGCALASSKQACQSAGAATGEIVSGPLDGTLGFIADVAGKEGLVVSVGIDLAGTGSSLLDAECSSGGRLAVTGSVVAPLGTIDKMSSGNTLTFAQAAGKQTPEAFEEGSPSTLQASIGGAGAEQAGLASKGTIENAEPVEIKGEAN